jgi:hypothetical protein
MYLLQQNKWQLSALLIASPFLLNYCRYCSASFLKFRLEGYPFYTIVIELQCCFFSLSFERINSEYSETIGLWFTNFEFNASIYYIIRQIGFDYWLHHPYNWKIIPLFILLFVLYQSFTQKIKLQLIYSTVLLLF